MPSALPWSERKFYSRTENNLRFEIPDAQDDLYNVEAVEGVPATHGFFPPEDQGMYRTRLINSGKLKKGVDYDLECDEELNIEKFMN